MASVRKINPASLRKLQAYVNDLPKKIRDVGSKTIKEAVETYYEALYDAIETQKYSHMYAPLSAEWLKRKKDPRFWINYGDLLVEGLVMERREVTGRYTNRSYVVGFTDNAIHEGSGLSYAHLAYILEFGWGAIPSRPAIVPTWEEHKRSITATAKKSFETRWRHDRYRG